MQIYIFVNIYLGLYRRERLIMWSCSRSLVQGSRSASRLTGQFYILVLPNQVCGDDDRLTTLHPSVLPASFPAAPSADLRAGQVLRSHQRGSPGKQLTASGEQDQVLVANRLFLQGTEGLFAITIAIHYNLQSFISYILSLLVEGAPPYLGALMTTFGNAKLKTNW